MPSAFVSHSTLDDSYVAEMESFLRAAGFDRVFNDASSISPDEKFWQKIQEDITQCDTLVVIITAASSSSNWVKREVEFARSLSKRLIPIWIEDCRVPSLFDGRDVIDFRPRARSDRRFDIGRIFRYAPDKLIGRNDEKKLLNDSWQKVLRMERGRAHVLSFVAFGGEGKTSLVSKWTAELANQDWPGCDIAFAWSFHNQGMSEQMGDSSDLFLKEALNFFGDDETKEFAVSNAGSYEKGQLLARMVGRRRSLLILDGLESLQYGPSSCMYGQLKDHGITALMKGLAADNRGLCLVTTRYSLKDLEGFLQTTAFQLKLPPLSREAGAHLLQSLGVKGSLLRNLSFQGAQLNEFEKLAEDVRGHALTLNLLGTYLRDAHAGDIRKRDLVKLEEADAERQGGQAFRVMEAYERELEHEGGKGLRALAVLRLLGLFDRPLSHDCLGALLKAPTISGLTEPLVNLTEAQRSLTFSRLEDAKLLTVKHGPFAKLDSLDAHPLVREYFAKRGRQHSPEAWRAAHERLFRHLCETAPKCTICDGNLNQPTLEELQPLYQAITHGCNAGCHEEAYNEVYHRRISRCREYAVTRFGVFGSDLEALACFFDTPWIHPATGIRPNTRYKLEGTVARYLHALGRFKEAQELFQLLFTEDYELGEYTEASQWAMELSEIELVLGNINAAIENAEESISSISVFRRGFEAEATYSHVLHQAGRYSEAVDLFKKADELPNKYEGRQPRLYSTHNFHLCDLLLTEAEHAAWRICLNSTVQTRSINNLNEMHLVKILSPRIEDTEPLEKICRDVLMRASQALSGLTKHARLLDSALNLLACCRAEFYSKILASPNPNLLYPVSKINEVVSDLRRAGILAMLPLGLLTRAWFSFLTGAHTGAKSAQDDLDEAWEIAERGAMKLQMADIHLHRARLFFRKAEYPWDSPTADLVAAEALINECGYHRRDEELGDAKSAILGNHTLVDPEKAASPKI